LKTLLKSGQILKLESSVWGVAGNLDLINLATPSTGWEIEELEGGVALPLE
jgi:hypothetical protein